MFGSIPPLDALSECISKPETPIGMRMRAAYYLRHLHSTSSQNDQEQVVSILKMGLLNTQHGSLLRHEFAYVMGQMKDERSCSVLEEVLSNDSDCVMVRHECAEALGAIGARRSKPTLEQILARHPDCLELTETCRLALDVIDWRVNGGDGEMPVAACACMLNPYSSVDPAPPHPSHQNKSAQELGDILCDENLQIFDRYRAMFSLRNKGGEKCVLQLCRALTTDTSSALLRHEVAYVLGQMQHPASVEALETSLRRQDEHDMVRHESAEALGAIEGRWEDCEKILQEFAEDKNIVVSESCLVALDAADYWGHTNQDSASEEGSDSVCNSFSQQKNESPPNRVLVNHFNVTI
mmetsp:Transcript_26517/g.39228  ORF Transcript_26517/g.39228 Transcript_26517/m.39228 type:complete len:352 (+) Transcript_26517:132-1187(+)